MRIFAILASFILVFGPFCTNLSTDTDDDRYSYEPTDVDLLDLGYKTQDCFSTQWWYFDAIFSNNYSITLCISNLFIARKIGFFLIRINIYENGNFLEEDHEFIPFREITYSSDKSDLSYKGSEIFNAKYDDDGKINVTLNVALSKIQVNLRFNELVKGWKGFTGKGWYSVPIPKAQVDGVIVVNDQTIIVDGFGYFEHAWGVKSLHRSWEWGKFSSLSTSTVFSRNMKNSSEEDVFFVVINTDEFNYTSIDRENISYRNVDYVFNYGRFVPVKSVLEINQGPISLNVTFEAVTFNFTRVFLFAKHWRFHMHVYGNIMVDGKTEEIDDTQIMEYVYFF
jgi:hypothetical protein